MSGAQRQRMQGRRIGVAGVLFAVLLWAAACGSARRGEPLTGPHALQDPVLLRGERVFALQCSQCHPGGEAGLGPAINNKPLPGWLLRFQIRQGLGVMPSFSSEEIPADDLDALVRYIRELRRQPSSGS
jgi:mono/diheme cytochrome c family protein